MKYPFSDSVAAFQNKIKTFAELAETDSPFDVDFPNRLPKDNAYKFDKVKEMVCVYRSPKEQKLLHSADALVIYRDHNADVKKDNRWFFFIEFKNQKVENIQSVKDPDDNDLMMKAFDSLSICSMTFSRDMTMAELQRRAIFVVVYPRQDYSDRFLAVLNELSKDSKETRPLWNLDKLCDAGFYAKVRTIDDEQFRKEYPHLL